MRKKNINNFVGGYDTEMICRDETWYIVDG